MRAVFLDVLEMNLAITPVILLLGLFSGKIRSRYGARWMKGIWFFVALRLAVPYNFAFPVIEISLAEPSFPAALTGSADADEERQTQGTQENSGQSMADSVPGDNGWEGERAVPKHNLNSPVSLEESGAKRTDGVQEERRQISLNPYPEQRMGPAMGAADGSSSVTGILAAIWAAGCALSFLYLLAGYVMFRIKVKRGCAPLKDEALRASVCRLQKRFLGNQTLSVSLCRGIHSPMVTGFLHPMLLLPSERKSWSRKELTLILAHESCHIKNRDLWLKLLMLFACGLGWFNPVLHWAKRQFFYEMELACDGEVLTGQSRDVRESYARVMLSFARAAGQTTALTTGFQGDKKRMKKRIDNMMDLPDAAGKNRKGIIALGITGLLILSVSLMVSCGYVSCGYGKEDEDGRKNETVQSAKDEEGHDGVAKPQDADEPQEDVEAAAAGQRADFTYNNEYNEMIRCHGDYTYIGREDGIYRIREGEEEETLIYANDYNLRRGMELYQNFLYFCGSTVRGEAAAATIYRMDLDSLSVEDALSLFSQTFEGLYGISIYEGNLYVAKGDFTRIGFALDEAGRITKALDETAQDFPYREYNEYMKLQNELWTTSMENSAILEQMEEKYQALMDVTACRKLLGGCWIVSKYKDESQRSFYLEKPDGTYEYLFDSVGYPILVTEEGVYYPASRSEDIWFLDYASREKSPLFGQNDREWREIQLLNYDETYIYYTSERYIGRRPTGEGLMEDYLMRVPRHGGGQEKVFRIDGDLNIAHVQSSSAIDGNFMYFRQGKRRSLDPDQNGMQRENSGEPSEDAKEMRRIAEEFAAAYFAGDRDRMAQLLAGEAGDLFPYPEAADQIEETYLSGLPEAEMGIGDTGYLSFEFTGNPEVEEGIYCYLSMELTKTENGWRITSYGLEM